MSVAANLTRVQWSLTIAVFAVVLGFDLALVAVAGTDVPFYDQWDVEGRWLYPLFCDGNLHFSDLFATHNEHRLLWTHLLNLGIFSANGQWDPLVQLVANGLLRGVLAAGVAWPFMRESPAARSAVVALLVALGFVPLAAWHVALWGFESQVLFAVALSLLTIGWLTRENLSSRDMVIGMAAGAAALCAMAPAALVGVALLSVAFLRWVDTRQISWRLAASALALTAAAWFLRVERSPQSWQARAWVEAAVAAGRALAWPHTRQPLAAFVMNLPLALLFASRLTRRRAKSPNEDFVTGAAIWAVAVAIGVGWARGGNAELRVGVPSRYVDFLVLLPLANAWSTVALVRHWSSGNRALARPAGIAWAAFVAVGWLGISTESLDRVILPRARDTEAPVRLMRAYQKSGDPAVFSGQPRLLVPHPDIGSVRAVVNDSRLQGRLPPSLQPERPMGPLSRGVRWLLGREWQ